MKVNQLCCFMLLLMMMALCDASRLINYFNKAPLKSIKSKDGDVIDCILLSEQPALDHPSLKDHRILMTPSYHPEGLEKLFNSRNDEKPITQLWQLAGKCPQGSIPVRRGKKEDGFFSVIKSFLQKDKTNREKLSAGMELISQVKSYQSVASYAMGAYYGAKAIMNVWQPQLQQPNEYSSSQLWITENSFGSNQNTIQAGWHVNPELYGDARTRFFMHWTRDNFKSTGCYNLLCSGFVQITNEIVLGGSIFPLSNFNGSQSEISILIWKSKDGDIIDCVHIYQQLAFDNPLLKGHWILQMRPNYQPELGFAENKISNIKSTNNELEQKPISQLLQLAEKGPDRTIPIRRAKQEDILRTSSMKTKNFGRKLNTNFPKTGQHSFQEPLFCHKKKKKN
ncbi:protein neprosin-like isoform X1 [Coffea arabica]|uniref:Protein neprosin-like isoform X1 n=1 Tax=Coffea arabica TaxID=13443 RepID=A0ABM4WII4_COFAR